MFSQKLTVNDALDYILNDESDFGDLEIDSYFDETDAIENDEVEANIIIWMKMGTLISHETMMNLYQLYLRHLKM